MKIMKFSSMEVCDYVPGRTNNVQSCIKLAISLKFALSYLKEFCVDRSNGKSAFSSQKELFRYEYCKPYVYQSTVFYGNLNTVGIYHHLVDIEDVNISLPRL